MKIPEFTAEASNYKSTKVYIVARPLHNMHRLNVVPALVPWFRSQRFYKCLASEIEYCDMKSGFLEFWDIPILDCYLEAEEKCSLMDKSLPPELPLWRM